MSRKKSDKGYNTLWQWVRNQKYFWRKACKGKGTPLSRENMTRLVHIGMGKSIEEGPSSCRDLEIPTPGWQERFIHLQQFHREFHHCDLSGHWYNNKHSPYYSLANWSNWQRLCFHNKTNMAATGQLRYKNTPCMTDRQEALLAIHWLSLLQENTSRRWWPTQKACDSDNRRRNNNYYTTGSSDGRSARDDGDALATRNDVLCESIVSSAATTIPAASGTTIPTRSVAAAT
jgi:hypothetical protein